MYDRNSQKGDFLLEAMVGTLITALVSLGTLAISARVMLMQEEMSRQETIVSGLREQLYQSTVQCNPGAQEVRDVNFTRAARANLTVRCIAPAQTFNIGGANFVINIPMRNVTATVIAGESQVEYGLGIFQ